MKIPPAALLAMLLLFSCGTTPEKNKPNPAAASNPPAAPELSATPESSAPAATAETPASSDSAATAERTPSTEAGPLPLSTHLIHLQKGVDLTLSIPEGYGISVAYEGLHRLRFLTKSPDGRLFATDMCNTSDNKRGRVYIFDDWDATGKQFRKVSVYKEGLHNPNQVAFYEDKRETYIYISETGTLTRYRYHPGDLAPSGKCDTIATFPDYGLGYKYGGWHLTRSVAFHDHKLYVSVGSSCNACIEKEEMRASVLEMNPDGSSQRRYATGLRNSVGMKWVGRQLWVTSMGRDLLGADKPEDLFGKVKEGVFYGWPYYFQYKDSIYADTAMQRMAREQKIKIPAPPPLTWCGFEAHSAPLGFAYLENFDDPALNNSFLVALHGSTTVSRQRGNCIVQITGRHRYRPVVDGFLIGKTEKDRKGRPCDIIQMDGHAFFFTDDHNGALYYVWKQK